MGSTSCSDGSRAAATDLVRLERFPHARLHGPDTRHSVASARTPPGFSTRAISSTASRAPSKPPKCSIDDSEYADVEAAVGKGEFAAVHAEKSQMVPPVFERRKFFGMRDDPRVALGAGARLPFTRIQVGGDDELHRGSQASSRATRAPRPTLITEASSVSVPSRPSPHAVCVNSYALRCIASLFSACSLRA